MLTPIFLLENLQQAPASSFSITKKLFMLSIGANTGVVGEGEKASVEVKRNEVYPMPTRASTQLSSFTVERVHGTCENVSSTIKKHKTCTSEQQQKTTIFVWKIYLMVFVLSSYFFPACLWWWRWMLQVDYRVLTGNGRGEDRRRKQHNKFLCWGKFASPWDGKIASWDIVKIPLKSRCHKQGAGNEEGNFFLMQ